VSLYIDGFACGVVWLQVERHPSLLFQDVEEGLAHLRLRMPGRDIDRMVERNPALILKLSVDATLSEGGKE